MAAAAKIHIIERGRDPRQYALLAFGGAGPIHAAGVARLLKQRRIVYPLAAGVLSAIGFLVAPVSFEFSTSQPRLLGTTDWTEINALLADLERQGRSVVAEAGVPAADITVSRRVDARFAGQINEISVELPAGELGTHSGEQLQTAFEKAYNDLYGHLYDGVPVEIVTWRIVASGRLGEVRLEEHDVGDAGTAAAPTPRARRPVYWFEADGYADTAVYDRYSLHAGATISGPAVAEERESTVLVPPGCTATVDAHRNLTVTTDS
jgi:N-methylhydantoinase A/oxoprolinase/acetone carboxylase beta subunit